MWFTKKEKGKAVRRMRMGKKAREILGSRSLDHENVHPVVLIYIETTFSNI